MKKIFLLLLLVLSAFTAAFAQRIPAVGVIAFEAGSGVSAADAANVTGSVISELSSWGTLNIVQGSAGADYIIRGTLSRQGSSFVLSALTINANTQQELNTYTEQAGAVNNISIFSFCLKAVDRVPLPNYLLGTWQASLNMPDGPIVCIIEFKSDRTVAVERYDTWESRQNNSLRYEGYGKGIYLYAGFANRTITVNSQQVRIDAIVNINLTLEETLPNQTSVIAGLYLVFNGERTSFNLVNGTLPCGTNYDGPSVYPSASLGFVSFTKIR